MLLKSALHLHTASDPLDNISYTEKELIDHARQKGFQLLSITCHRKIIFNEFLHAYAKSQGITLLPGLEAEVNSQHIVILNAHPSAEKINNFQDLQTYRHLHPESFVLAPHPFFPIKSSLRHNLVPNLNHFDALELSFCYTPYLNFNRRTITLSQKQNLPLIATPDCHYLSFLNTSYCLINTPKPTPSLIFSALRSKKFKNHSKPLSFLQTCDFSCKIISNKIKSLICKKPPKN